MNKVDFGMNELELLKGQMKENENIMKTINSVERVYTLVRDNCLPAEAEGVINMVQRLVAGLPLVELTNADDQWVQNEEGKTVHRRRESLEKITDGEVTTYYDNDIVECVDMEKSIGNFGCSLVTKMVNDKFPVVFPYMPSRKFRAYTTINYKEENGKNATELKVFKIMHPVGALIDVNKSFKWNSDINDWEEVETQNETN